MNAFVTPPGASAPSLSNEEIAARLRALGAQLDSAHWIADAFQLSLNVTTDRDGFRAEGIARMLAELLEAASNTAFDLAEFAENAS